MFIRLCIPLLALLGAGVGAQLEGDEEPPSARLSAVSRALTRNRDLLDFGPLDLVLQEEAQLFEEWIEGLRRVETRAATLAGIALEDAMIAESIESSLPEGELSIETARRELEPILDRVRARVEGSLASYVTRVERSHRRVLGKLEGLAPSQAPGPWGDREDAALHWIDVRTATLALVYDVEQLPEQGGSLQVQVKLERLIEGVEARWGEVEEYLAKDLRSIQRLRESQALEDLAEEKELRGCRGTLAERLGSRLEDLGPAPALSPRESIGIGLAALRAGDPERGLETLRGEGPYGGAMAHGLECEETLAYNRAHGDELMGPIELDVLERINAYRTSLGRTPLEAEARLVRCAREHTVEMVAKGYFSHESPLEERRRPKDRARLAEYPEPEVSELIYYQERRLLASSTFDSWQRSPVHHRLMVDDRVHQAGMGRDKNHITAVLGRAQR